MLKTAFAAGFSNIAVADISRPLWSGLRSASSPAFTHTNSIMADSMIGKRFDFLLRDETRLEGTLEGVNQDDRQLTISNGAALGVALSAALQLLIEFAGSSTRTWKTQHVQICSRLHGAHTGQTFWSWHLTCLAVVLWGTEGRAAPLGKEEKEFDSTQVYETLTFPGAVSTARWHEAHCSMHCLK